MSDVFGLTAEQHQRTAAAVRKSESESIGNADTSRSVSSRQLILVRITDVDDDAYAWEQVRRLSDGNIEAVPQGLTGTLEERTAYGLGQTSAAVDDVVFITRIMLDNGDDTFTPAWGIVGGDNTLWVQITGSVKVGDVYRHSWTEMRRTATGFETVPEDPRTGSTTEQYAIAPEGQHIENDTICRIILERVSDGEAETSVATILTDTIDLADCNDNVFTQVKKVAFKKGFSLAFASGEVHVAEVTLATKELDVVTDVTCNGDGTITVTKETITVIDDEQDCPA